MLNLRYYQYEAKQAVYDYWTRNPHGNALLSMATGCHAIGTPILMFDGSIKNVENVVVGDQLMGDDKTPRNVLNLARGNEKLYKIIPVKGAPFIVNEGHILSLQTTNEGESFPCKKTGKEIVNINVREYLLKSKHFKHIHKLYKRSVDFGTKELSISPYIVGVMLGDGSLNNQPAMTGMDTEVSDEFLSEIKKFGCKAKKQTKKDNKASTYVVSFEGSTRSIENPFTRVLKNEGLWGQLCNEKHIPFKYKTGDRQQRLELLAGLIDTDGHLEHGCFDFVSKSKQLAEDITFLSRSLGLSAYVKQCVKTCQNNFSGVYYRVGISGNIDIVPCKVPRQKALPRLQKKDNLKTGFSVEEYGFGDFYGFELDGNHLYLTGDFFVHHNTGKSLVIADITKDVIQKRDNTRVIILSHVSEILEQNTQKLHFLWPQAPIGIYSATLKQKRHQDRIIIAGIQSVHKKANVMGWFSLVIVDESHLISEKDVGMYRKFIADLRRINPNIRILGLSATPWRTKGGLLTEGDNPMFDEIVYTYTMRQAIDDKYLSPLISKHSLIQADMSDVSTRMGEFHLGEMAAAFDNEYLTQMALNEIIQYGKDRKAWLLFGSSVEHAHRLCEVLIEKDIEAACITGETDTLQREGILRKFKNGEKYRAITNNNVLTTGTDIPRIDLIAMLRATKSSGLLLQAVGRGVRLSPETGKSNALLLDYGGNLERFGCIDEIEAPSIRKKKGESSMPMKVCPKCQSAHPISRLECGDCGYMFPIDTTYKHDEKATNAAAMSSEKAGGEWFDIDEVNYDEHPGRLVDNVQKPNTLKVTYVSGARLFREWVCINHDGFGRRKAISWIEKRLVCEDELPIEEKYGLINAFTINDAVSVPDILMAPHKIKVKRNGKYEEIVEYAF